jgi:Ca-activated chloride channel family protein
MPHSRNFFSAQFALVSLLLFAASVVVVVAQDESKPVKIETEGRLVRLNVIVTESSNRVVTDLKKEEFRVLEDGKPQTLSYFSREELPVSYGLVVDSSGSMRTLISHIIEAGKDVVAGNKTSDETFIMNFIDSDHILLGQGFTSNKYALEDALDEIYIQGGLTALMDASDQAVAYLKKNQKSEEAAGPRRHAIVLITDGEDRGSRERNADAFLNRLRQEDVQFFIIGLTKLSNLQSSRDKAMNFLTRLAEATGGRAYFPKSTAEIPGIADEIARDLHTQYVLGYAPANALTDGSYRKVQVTVPDSPTRKKLNVIVRPGYTAPRL